MWHLRYLQHVASHAILGGIYLLSCLCGLMAVKWPGGGGSRSGGVSAVHYHRWWRLYGYLLAAFVLCYSPHAFYMVYTRMDFLRQNHLLLIVGCQHYVLLLLSTYFMLYKHTTHQLHFIAWLNKLLWCRHRLLQLLHTRRLRNSALKLHTPRHLWSLYLLLVSFIGSSAHSIFVLHTDPVAKSSNSYFCSVIFFYGLQLGLQLCLGLYVLALLLITHLLQHCNLLLARILRDAVHVHDSLVRRGMPQRWKLHAARQHWLALELWRLWRLQSQLLQLCRHLCSLHGAQLLAFVVYVAIECIIHGFFTYFVEFSAWWLRKFGRPAHFIIWGLLVVASLFLQLALVVVHTHRLRHICAETRRTLQKGSLALPPSCSKALRQTLNLYGLQLQLNEKLLKMSVCDLFELKNELLFGIGQTIIIYILILIQFDKIVNA